LAVGVKQSTGHTHTGHTEQRKHPRHRHTPAHDKEKSPNEHLPQALNNARRWRDDGACHLPRPGGCEERFGRARCLTLRYSLLLSVWVDPSVEQTGVTFREVVTRHRTRIFYLGVRGGQIDRVIKLVSERNATSHWSLVNNQPDQVIKLVCNRNASGYWWSANRLPDEL